MGLSTWLVLLASDVAGIAQRRTSWYSKQDTVEVVLKRLLMYGISSGGGTDIPYGAVRAFPDYEAENPVEGFVGVGCAHFHESDSEVFSK